MRFVARPRSTLKFGAIYPMLEEIAGDPPSAPPRAVAIALNGVPVKQVRDTIRSRAWNRFGLRIVSTVDELLGELLVWPVETDLETQKGFRWRVIHAEAPARRRAPAPGR